MRYWCLVITIALLVSAGGCKSLPAFQDPFTRPQIDWQPGLVLGTGEAGRILGNPSRLEKSTAYMEDGTRAYQSAFRDDWRDPSTGKSGILYYMYEEYRSAGAARSNLDSILIADHLNPADAVRLPGGAELHNLGNRMVMILKENRLIRLKVNQETSRCSFDEFRKVAEELAQRL